MRREPVKHCKWNGALCLNCPRFVLLTAQARGEDFFGPVDTVLVATTMCCVQMLYLKKSVVKTFINIGVMDQQYITYIYIYSVLLKRGKRWCNCQRLYFSSDILESFKCDPLAGTGVEYAISTCLGTQQKTFREVVLEVKLVPDAIKSLPLLNDPIFIMKLEFSNFGQVENLKYHGYSLAADIEIDSHVVNLQGLLGADLIHFIKPLKLVLRRKLPRVLSSFKTALIFFILTRLPW